MYIEGLTPVCSVSSTSRHRLVANWGMMKSMDQLDGYLRLGKKVERETTWLLIIKLCLHIYVNLKLKSYLDGRQTAGPREEKSEKEREE